MKLTIEKGIVPGQTLSQIKLTLDDGSDKGKTITITKLEFDNVAKIIESAFKAKTFKVQLEL